MYDLTNLNQLLQSSSIIQGSTGDTFNEINAGLGFFKYKEGLDSE